MKTVLVTGANGYIGRHVLSELSHHNVAVIALDIAASDISYPTNITPVTANIFSSEFQLSDYLDVAPDVCLHLAWRNGFVHNDPSHIEDLSGHFRFIEQLISSGVPQIAIMGTMHEVGYWEGPIDEHTPCNPQSLYGIAKNCLRQAVFAATAQEATTVQWLRAFYLYGGDENSQSIFGKITRAAKAGQTTFPFTTGKNQFDFLPIEELARQICFCILQDDVTGIINCCSGTPLSLAEQVESFIRDNDLSIALEYGTFPDRPYDSPGIWGDNTKILAIMKAHEGLRSNSR